MKNLLVAVLIGVLFGVVFARFSDLAALSGPVRDRVQQVVQAAYRAQRENQQPSAYDRGQPEVRADAPLPADAKARQVEYVDISRLSPVKTISTGQRVSIKRYVGRHGRTIVEFTAPW